MRFIGNKENLLDKIYQLNEKGQLILGIKAPNLFKETIKNLLDFWK